MITTPKLVRSKYRMKSAMRWLPMTAWDVWQNRRCHGDSQRILVSRHRGKHATMFRDFFAWVVTEVPELASRLEFHHLPYTLPAKDRFTAYVSWISDTVDLWSPTGYSQACRLLSESNQRGLKCLNPIDCIVNAGKGRGAQLMSQAGVRTPRSVPLVSQATIDPIALGFEFPLLVREERGHGRPSHYVKDLKQLRALDLSRYWQPILVEFIDTQDPVDGLYRKYRYVSAGDAGIPRHLITDQQWDVRPHRRVRSEKVMAQEAAYIQAPDAHHAILQKARKALGMDIVGFDYSFTHDGEPVIWEANPYLDMNYPRHVTRGHLALAVERTFAVVARCYLLAAGAEVPHKVQALLEGVATIDSRVPTIRSFPKSIAS